MLECSRNVLELTMDRLAAAAQCSRHFVTEHISHKLPSHFCPSENDWNFAIFVHQKMTGILCVFCASAFLKDSQSTLSSENALKSWNQKQREKHSPFLQHELSPKCRRLRVCSLDITTTGPIVKGQVIESRTGGTTAIPRDV